VRIRPSSSARAGCVEISSRLLAVQARLSAPRSAGRLKLLSVGGPLTAHVGGLPSFAHRSSHPPSVKSAAPVMAVRREEPPFGEQSLDNGSSKRMQCIVVNEVALFAVASRTGNDERRGE